MTQVCGFEWIEKPVPVWSFITDGILAKCPSGFSSDKSWLSPFSNYIKKSHVSSGASITNSHLCSVEKSASLWGFSPSGDEGKAIGFSARESWWYWALWQHVSNVNLHLPKALKMHNSMLGYLLGPPSSEQLDSEITAESWFSESRINRASLENCLKFSWMSNLYWLFPNQAFLNALIFQAGKGFCCLFLWVPGAQGSRFKITPHFDVL